MPKTASEPLINIAIADDHNLFRQVFVASLSLDRSINFIFQARNCKELLDKLKVSIPEILLLDINMPKTNGIEALRTISDLYPGIKVLILSAFTDLVYVAQCFQLGAYSYLNKSMDIEEILAIIKKTSNNDRLPVYTSSSRLPKGQHFSSRHNTEDLLPLFSSDELELLKLLKAEKTTEEISQMMNLSKRTIEMKRDKMRAKSKSKTIGGLLVYAFKRGFVK